MVITNIQDWKTEKGRQECVYERHVELENIGGRGDSGVFPSSENKTLADIMAQFGESAKLGHPVFPVQHLFEPRLPYYYYLKNYSFKQDLNEIFRDKNSQFIERDNEPPLNIAAPELRIVIPARNEEVSIGKVIDRTRMACRDAEILVVDDGSEDNTAAIAREKGAIVISNKGEHGYGKALKMGFAYNSNPHVKYIAFLDADNTYPPERIPELYDLCKDKDVGIAVGSRFLGKNKGMPIVRKIGNKFFAFLISLYTGKKITDAGSGLRVFKASLLQEFQDLPDGLNYTPGMTTKALHLGITYKEIPIEYEERVGESKLNSIKDGYRFLGAISKSVRNHTPLAFFGTVGIPLLIGGTLLGIYSIGRWLTGHLFEPSFILTTLLILVGMFVMMFGLIADMIVDLRRVVERMKREMNKNL